MDKIQKLYLNKKGTIEEGYELGEGGKLMGILVILATLIIVAGIAFNIGYAKRDAEIEDAVIQHWVKEYDAKKSGVADTQRSERADNQV